MLGALAIIAAVLFSLQFFARTRLRRFAGVGGGRRRLIAIVETAYLPNASYVHVIKIGDTYAVVGQSANHIAKLADVPADTIGAWLSAQAAAHVRGRDRTRS
jgi:flagellar biogenesis protein FliO